MNYCEFYKSIYNILGEITPIKADCGKLCGAACCYGDEETGMYLFPSERIMYKQSLEWLHIEKSHFEYKKNEFVDIAICKPFCNRNFRPLACRIFPLFPYIDSTGELIVILDPRGRGICPIICAGDIHLLDNCFIRKVEYISKIMVHCQEMYQYLYEMSRLIEDSTDFLK